MEFDKGVLYLNESSDNGRWRRNSPKTTDMRSTKTNGSYFEQSYDGAHRQSLKGMTLLGLLVPYGTCLKRFKIIFGMAQIGA